MAAIHQINLETLLLKANALSPTLLYELFRTVDESISYELEIASGTGATTLPGFGSGAAQIETIQTFVLITDTSVTLNWNAANTSLVVGASQRNAVFMAYGVSTTTAPTIANSGSTTALVQVIAGGT